VLPSSGKTQKLYYENCVEYIRCQGGGGERERERDRERGREGDQLHLLGLADEIPYLVRNPSFFYLRVLKNPPKFKVPWNVSYCNFLKFNDGDGRVQASAAV
jgi:hypothetical protein